MALPIWCYFVSFRFESVQFSCFAWARLYAIFMAVCLMHAYIAMVYLSRHAPSDMLLVII